METETKKNLIVALKEERFEDALALIDKGIDINVRLQNDLTPIFYVAENASYDLFLKFIERGADIRVLSNSGVSVFHYAVLGGHLETVKYFIEHGFRADTLTKKGVSALHFGAQSGNLEIVKFLVEEKGIKLNVATPGGTTPLHYAAVEGNDEIVQYFLEKGVSANVSSNGGVTPLHYAAQGDPLEKVSEQEANSLKRKRLHTVELLLKYNADATKVDNNGRTPIYRALEYNCLDIAELLKKYGGITDDLIFCAFKKGNISILKWLLNEGMDPNTREKSSGKTALFYLSHISQIDSAETLFTAGADLNIQDRKGRTAISYAAELTSLDPLEFFLSKGDAVNVNLPDKFGRTPLFYAAQAGYQSAILQLLDNGATVTSDVVDCYKKRVAADDALLEILNSKVVDAR